MEPKTASSAMEPTAASSAMEATTASSAMEPTIASSAMEPTTESSAMEPTKASSAMEPTAASSGKETTSLFSVCKLVLDSIRKDQGSTTEDEFRQQVDEAAKKLSKSYYTRGGKIDYSDAFIQAAYIKTHFTIHACLTESCLELNSALQNRISSFDKTQNFNIAMIGCGPATEVVGFIKFLSKVDSPELANKEKPKPKFGLYDSANSWSNVIQTMWDNVTPYYSIPDMSKEFKKLNLLSSEDEFDFTTEFGGTNFVMFNYVFSELKKLTPDQESALKNNLKEIMNSVPNDCIIQIIDTNEKETMYNVLNLFCDVTSQNQIWLGNYDIRLSQQKEDLGPYLGCDWSPKLGTKYFCLVSIKTSLRTES